MVRRQGRRRRSGPARFEVRPQRVPILGRQGGEDGLFLQTGHVRFGHLAAHGERQVRMRAEDPDDLHDPLAARLVEPAIPGGKRDRLESQILDPSVNNRTLGMARLDVFGALPPI